MPIFKCRLNLTIAPLSLLVLLALGPIDARAETQPLLDIAPGAIDVSGVTVSDTRATAVNDTASDASAAKLTTTPSVAANTSDTSTSGNTANDSQVVPLRPVLSTETPVVTNTPSSSTANGQDEAKPVAATTSSNSGKTKSSLGHLLKSNIAQTFELDPRLKSDLTQGNDLFRPIKLLEDYVAVGYNPYFEWDRTGNQPYGATTYSKTNMSVYVVGPITKHLSMWLQPLPIVNTPAYRNISGPG
jgi:hypothetical protein